MPARPCVGGPLSWSPRTMPNRTHRISAVRKAADTVVLAAQLYAELLRSALTLLPRPEPPPDVQPAASEG